MSTFYTDAWLVYLELLQIFQRKALVFAPHVLQDGIVRILRLTVHFVPLEHFPQLKDKVTVVLPVPQEHSRKKKHSLPAKSALWEHIMQIEVFHIA
jgi:hypothetical protein